MDDEPISIIFAEEGYFVALNTSTILFMKKYTAMPYGTPQKTGCWIKKNAGPTGYEQNRDGVLAAGKKLSGDCWFPT
jgi:hypothetical protein